MYETILIPTDGSDNSILAGEHGNYLAEVFDAKIHVINVADVETAAGPFNAWDVDENFANRLIEEGEKGIEAIEEVIGGRKPVESTVIKGEPSETILEYADNHDVDVIAMGTHDRTGLNRYIAGSVTERVVRLAEVPVLTVCATDRSQIRRDYNEILIPTDGNEPASAAVEHGLAIAQRTGARIHAVNIVDVGEISINSNYFPLTEMREHLKLEGRVATEDIVTQAQECGLDVITDVQEGFPAKNLLEYADEHEVDLIAMGTAGRTGLSRYLIGSTTERIIRHSDIPVLALNARENDSG